MPDPRSTVIVSDSAARQRALDPGTSFIVQAPAGSGKTELLIQRYLRLLTTVDTPEGVVAITFTRKAAGEMRERVLQALHAAGDGERPVETHKRVTWRLAREVMERDRARGWFLSEDPTRMRIETIDALCMSITRQMPWMSRFGAVPGIQEKARELYEQAARRALADADPVVLRPVLLHVDNDFRRAIQLIADMLERRDQWLRRLGTGEDIADARVELEALLSDVVRGCLERVSGAFPEDAVAELRALGHWVSDIDCAALDRWLELVKLLTKTDDQWRGKVDARNGYPPNHRNKSRCEKLLGRLQKESALLETLLEIKRLPSPKYDDAQWAVLEHLLKLLPHAVGSLQVTFRERGVIDFVELALGASAALGTENNPTDLALTLGYRIEHLLVDEFQDTSITQFDLLKKLTAGWEKHDGRTLFLVGDPMQSIYRFRQAEVSLFLEAAAHGLGSVTLEPLTLTRNFRSGPGIVSWINDAFSQIFSKRDDIQSGAVAFAPSECVQSGEYCLPEIHAFVDDDGLGEAERVRSLIHSHAGTIAVLVRARAHAADIAIELRRSGIRYQSIEITQLGERAIIQDLMALTFALLHLGDRASWLGVLRAPWCGLTVHDVHALVNTEGDRAVWELLNTEPALSSDGCERVARILPVLRAALQERGRRPVREWVEATWRALGGPNCIAGPEDLEDAAAYFDLLEEVDGGGDIADYSALRKRVDDLFAQPDPECDGRVQIMTIHKAKGLEFDCVIVPGLGRTPPPDSDQLLIAAEHGEAGLLIAPMKRAGDKEDPIYKFLAHIEKEKTREEHKRLLYVATTRARQHLHLLGCTERKSSGELKEPEKSTFLRLIWPQVSAAFAAVAVPEQTAEREKTLPLLRRVAAGWEVPAPRPNVVWAQPSVQTAVAPAVAFAWVSETRRHLGTVVHRFLQHIAREGIEQWNDSRVASMRGAFETALRTEGVPPGELANGVKQVSSALVRILGEQRGRWILGAHGDAASEFAITGLLDGKEHQAFIDRTFVEDDVRWIIDFKTSSHEGGSIEEFYSREKKRYEEQLNRYARLLSQMDQRPVRLGLYFPLLGGWIEWAAPGALRRQASLFGA